MTALDHTVAKFTELDADVAEKGMEHARRCAAEGIVLRVTCCYRSLLDQLFEWRRGRETLGVPCRHDGVSRQPGTCGEHPLGLTVTGARPGYSWHNWRRAYDVAILSFPGDLTPKNAYDGPWGHVGEIGEDLDLEWGGRWKRADQPHFEDHGDRTLLARVKEARAAGLLA